MGERYLAPLRSPSSDSEHRVCPRNSSPRDSSENSLTLYSPPATTPRRRDTTVAQTNLDMVRLAAVWLSSVSSPTNPAGACGCISVSCSDPCYRRSPAWPGSDGFFSPRSPNGVAGEARGDRLENTNFRGGLRRSIAFLLVRRGVRFRPGVLEYRANVIFAASGPLALHGREASAC
jgi:hypothetical protein